MCKENGALLNEEPKQQDMFVPQQEEQLEEQLEQPMMYNAPLQEQQEEQLDPLNTDMMMQENMTERLSKQGTVAASRELERTADAGFQQGIQSRHGACDRRNTTKKKNRARAKLNTQGLSGYSGELSDRLKDNAAQQAEQVQKNRQNYDSWTQTKAGANESEMRKNGWIQEEGQENSDQLLEHELAMAGWLKDDRSRANLFSSDGKRRTYAAEELVDRLLEFEFKPNATCTLAAVQRAPEIARYKDLLTHLRCYLLSNHTGRIGINKQHQFNKFSLAFDDLSFTTEATVNLQGVNMDGSSLNKFEENTTLWKRLNMRSDRSNYKLEKETGAAEYERDLAEYKRDFLDKPITPEERLADIRQRTKNDISEEDYQRMKQLHCLHSDAELEQTRLFREQDIFRRSELGKNNLEEMTVSYRKKKAGEPLIGKEAEVMDELFGVNSAPLYCYLDTDDEVNAMRGNDAKLRGEAREKVMDKLLAMVPKFAGDPAYFVDNATVEELENVVKLSSCMDNVDILSRLDRTTMPYVSASKREQLIQINTVIAPLSSYLTKACELRGYAFSGDAVSLTKEKKQRHHKAADEAAAEYKQAAERYNKYYVNSDEQSQQKIAEAKELLGTDVGMTKHSLEMAESLREIETGRDAVGQLNEIKGASLRDSRTPQLQAEQQQRMIDKLIEFPLDADVISTTPDMEQMPKIIAHGKLMDEANKELASNKQTVNDLLPADKLAQLADYTAAFNALRDAAVMVINKAGLNTDGTARYLGKTPADAAADYVQLTDAQVYQRTMVGKMFKDYTVQHLTATAEDKVEIAKARELLGTNMGVTKESYKLATAIKANLQQEKARAKANKQWYSDWRNADANKDIIAAQTAYDAKVAVFDREAFELNRRAVLASRSDDKYAAKPIEAELVAHGISYIPTKDDPKLMSRAVEATAAKLLHLLDSDGDRAKLMSADPKQRAEVQILLANKLMVHDELPADLFTNPDRVQQLPPLLAMAPDVMNLEKLMDRDDFAKNEGAMEAHLQLRDLNFACRDAVRWASMPLYQNGLSEQGDSPYAGNVNISHQVMGEQYKNDDQVDLFPQIVGTYTSPLKHYYEVKKAKQLHQQPIQEEQKQESVPLQQEQPKQENVPLQ